MCPAPSTIRKVPPETRAGIVEPRPERLEPGMGFADRLGRPLRGERDIGQIAPGGALGRLRVALEGGMGSEQDRRVRETVRRGRDRRLTGIPEPLHVSQTQRETS